MIPGRKDSSGSLMPCRCVRSGRGFTLIELLVVVAIIAILMAVLLPSLNRARDQARKIKCASTLRSLVMNGILYSHEYNGFFVPGRNPSSTTVVWHKNYAFRVTLKGFITGIDAAKNSCSEITSFNLVCPSSLAMISADGQYANRYPLLNYSYGVTAENFTATAYHTDAPLSNPHDQVNAYKMSRITQPANRMAFIDALDWAVTYSNYLRYQNTGETNNTFGGTNRVAYRHNNEANIAMMDGHVESTTAAKLGANRNCWYNFYGD